MELGQGLNISCFHVPFLGVLEGDVASPHRAGTHKQSFLEKCHGLLCIMYSEAQAHVREWVCHACSHVESVKPAHREGTRVWDAHVSRCCWQSLASLYSAVSCLSTSVPDDCSQQFFPVATWLWRPREVLSNCSYTAWNKRLLGDCYREM